MFLKDFLAKFAGAPDNFNVDAESVEKIGRTFYFSTNTDITESALKIESLEEDIKIGDKEIAKLESELYDEKQHTKKLEKELDGLHSTFLSYELNPGETIGDLAKRNDELTNRVAMQQDSLNKFHRRHKEDQQEITNLRARKNKASVKRCLTTGRLMANFGGVEYTLENKN